MIPTPSGGGAGGRQQKVELVVDVKANTSQADQAFRQTAQQVTGISQAAQRAAQQVAQMQMGGGYSGGGGSPFSGIGGTRGSSSTEKEKVELRQKGFSEQVLNRLGVATPETTTGFKAATKVGAAAAAIYAGVSSASFVQTNKDNPYMTSAQFARGFFGSFVPGFETATGYVDALSGRTADLARAERNNERLSIRTASGIERSQLAYAQDVSRGSAIARADVLANSSLPAGPGGDRSTARGEYEYQQARKMLPLKDAIAKAEREQTISVREREQAIGRVQKIEIEGKKLAEQRARIEQELRADSKSLFGGISAGRRSELLAQQASLDDRIQANIGLQREARGGSREADIALAQSRASTAQQRANLLRGEAGELEDRANRTSGVLSQLGGLGTGGRFRLLSYLESAKGGRLSDLPQDAISTIQAFAPNFARQKFEEELKGDETFAKLREFEPGLGSDPAADRKAAADKDDAARQADFGADQKLAKDVAGTFSGAAGKDVDAIERLISAMMDARLKALETKIMQAQKK